MFMAYKSRRPAPLQETGPLYLGVIDHPKSGVWYKNMKMGVHTINNMLKNMKNRSPLATICPNKKITNHSARKTTVSKMRKSGFPKCEIKNITGHASEQALDAYDSGNEEEMYSMSRAINGEILTSKCNLNQQSNFSFGIDWNNFTDTNVTSSSSGNFYFSNCNVTINKNTTINQNPKKKRLAIISDSEDSQQ